jgi:iron-sulfur cluster assembly protein
MERVANILTVTPLAAQKVKEFLQKEGKPNAALRVYVAGGGCAGLTYGLALEEEVGEDDIVMHQNGIKLVVDPFSARYLKGAEIDYVESLMGSGFKINNPNVTSTCACGHSFSVY